LRTCLDNFAHEFVAEDVARPHSGDVAVVKVKVGAADRGRRDLQDGVVRIDDFRVWNALDPDIVAALHRLVESRAEVSSVGEVLTIHGAPDRVTAMLSVDFEDHISARDVEAVIYSIEQEVAKEFPIVHRLYIRPYSETDRS